MRRNNNLDASRVGGPKAAFGSAVACGILLGVFEGVGVLLNRAFSEVNRQTLPPRSHLNVYLPSTLISLWISSQFQNRHRLQQYHRHFTALLTLPAPTKIF